MEVLKHNTVEKVQMIEIDEEMVETSRQFLPEWSDCSDIVGSEKWCGDDKRVELYFEDALAWFIDRYSDSGKLFHENHPKLDIIIMDALYVFDLVFFFVSCYRLTIYHLIICFITVIHKMTSHLPRFCTLMKLSYRHCTML